MGTYIPRVKILHFAIVFVINKSYTDYPDLLVIFDIYSLFFFYTPV